jgi:hypothetical protein
MSTLDATNPAGDGFLIFGPYCFPYVSDGLALQKQIRGHALKYL